MTRERYTETDIDVLSEQFIALSEPEALGRYLGSDPCDLDPSFQRFFTDAEKEDWFWQEFEGSKEREYSGELDGHEAYFLPVGSIDESIRRLTHINMLNLCGSALYPSEVARANDDFFLHGVSVGRTDFTRDPAKQDSRVDHLSGDIRDPLLWQQLNEYDLRNIVVTRGIGAWDRLNMFAYNHSSSLTTFFRTIHRFHAITVPGCHVFMDGPTELYYKDSPIPIGIEASGFSCKKTALDEMVDGYPLYLFERDGDREQDMTEDEFAVDALIQWAIGIKNANEELYDMYLELALLTYPDYRLDYERKEKLKNRMSRR